MHVAVHQAAGGTLLRSYPGEVGDWAEGEALHLASKGVGVQVGSVRGRVKVRTQDSPAIDRTLRMPM